MPIIPLDIQGVSYSRKLHSKRGFPNLAHGRTSQFMFPKYSLEYQNVKIVKSKNKHKSNVVLKEHGKKDIKIDISVT